MMPLVFGVAFCVYVIRHTVHHHGGYSILYGCGASSEYFRCIFQLPLVSFE